MLSLSVLDSVDSLKAAEPEWEALCHRSPATTPFQHPAWVLPWWNHFGSGRLHVIALRDCGRLAALFPLFLHQWNGRRQLTIPGTGISDYLDLIAEPGMEDQAAEAVLACLSGSRREWDVADWQDLPPGSALLRLPGVHMSASAPCVAAPLPAAESGSFLRRLKQLGKAGPVRLSTLREDPEGEVLEQWIALHERCWQERGEPGMLRPPELGAFHREAAGRMALAGALRLYVLHVAGRAAAICYALRHRRSMYYYLGGFDPELKRFSPGRLAIEFAMREAAAEGAVRFDFLRGEEEWKFRLGGVRVPKYRIRIGGD